MISKRAFSAAAFLLAAADTIGTASAQNTPQLASHRAVYELTLDKATGGKAPAQARGRIIFDFTASCEGYAQNFRQITEMTPAEGSVKLSDMRSTTFETLDANGFHFKVETKVDNISAQAVDGKAQKGKNGAVAVDLARPKRMHLDIDGSALFPSEHLAHVISAARAGESLLEARIYDGTGDGDKAFDTLTVIGKPIETPAAEKAAQADALKNQKRWRTAISFFESGKRDGQPIYVLSFDLYENGVSRALKLDYGDFVLKGDMTELTLLPAIGCKK